MTFLAGASLLPLSYSEEVNTSAISTASYGTVAAIDNVLFDFLSLLGDAAMVRAFITYVLSGDRTPPSSASSLGNLLGSSLQSLPLIEVQAWGGLLFSDIDYIVSGISQAGDIALFGSDAGAQLRQWAHSGPNSKVVRWSADAMSSQYALDGGNDAVFQAVWDKSRSLSPTAILNELASSRLLTS